MGFKSRHWKMKTLQVFYQPSNAHWKDCSQRTWCLRPTTEWGVSCWRLKTKESLGIEAENVSIRIKAISTTNGIQEQINQTTSNASLKLTSYGFGIHTNWLGIHWRLLCCIYQEWWWKTMEERDEEFKKQKKQPWIICSFKLVGWTVCLRLVPLVWQRNGRKKLMLVTKLLLSPSLFCQQQFWY